MIDEGLPKSWPTDVLDAVRQFKQGHLVVTPPMFYAANADYGIWDLTTGEGGTGEELIELSAESRPEYGLITTQTCDLVEEGRPDHPWFQVVPVYPILDLDEAGRSLLENHRRSHLVLLDSPALPDGTWVADLRLEVPIEKSWLVGQDPIEAFRTEDAYELLGERLAAKKNRPAVATEAVDAVIRPLQNWLQGNAGGREAAKVEQLRLAVGPSRLQVDRASLLVLTNESPLPVEEREPWDRWWDRTRPKAAAAGIDLLANQYESLDSLSAREYRNAIELNFSYLSRIA